MGSYFGKEIELMQKRKSEENPDDGTQDGKQCIQHTREGLVDSQARFRI